MLGGRIHGVASASVLEVRAAANRTAHDGHSRFAIDPAEVARCEGELLLRGLDLIGFFHSHPGGSPYPSTHDVRDASAWPGYIHCIAAVDAAGRTQTRWYRVEARSWAEAQCEVEKAAIGESPACRIS